MKRRAKRNASEHILKSQEIDDLRGQIDFLNHRISNLEYSALLLDKNVITNFEIIIELIRPKKVTEESLIRIGNPGDGGYVLSNQILKSPKGKKIISIGVGDEFSFETFFLKNGFEVLGIDGSVENPLNTERNFLFRQRFVGGEFRTNSKSKQDSLFVTYEDVVRDSGWEFEVDLVKIDAEGHEYEILESSIANISKATQIIIEFHGIELILDRKFMQKIIEILSKLRETHSPIHLHGNNAGRAIRFAHGDFPTIFELTLLKQEMCESDDSLITLPGILDFPNVPIRSDIDLSPFISTQINSSKVLRTICDWL